MKRSKAESWDNMELGYVPDGEALQGDEFFAEDLATDCEEEVPMTEKEQLRRWKAEQANKVCGCGTPHYHVVNS